MEITPRQYGRLEMAAWALAKHSEHNEVCMVLSKGIMQVKDDNADGDDLDELRREIPDLQDDAGRLPDIPDWRDGTARQTDDDLLVQCRLIVAAHQGESLGKMIEAVKAGANISGSKLARLLGVNKARISEALNGKAKPYFIERFTEILGEGGAR